MMILLGFFGLVALAGGAALGFFAWHNLRKASQFGRPLSRIDRLQPGFRKVRGKVAALDISLRSPVTDKECVYYRLRVYEDKKRWTGVDVSEVPGGAVTAAAVGGLAGFFLFKFLESKQEKADSSWHDLIDDAVEVPLTIEDDTGLVEVDLEHAAVDLKEKARMVSNIHHGVPSRLKKLLEDEYDLDLADDDGHFKTLHIFEEVLLVGAKVTVVGPVEPREDETLCFQSTDKVLVVSERNVSKLGQQAHRRAMGYGVGAGAVLTLALGCLLGAFALAIGAALVSR